MRITVEIELEIDGIDFTPREPMVMYYKDGSGYPGSAPEIDWSTTKMYYGDKEFIDAENLSQYLYDELLDAYMEQGE